MKNKISLFILMLLMLTTFLIPVEVKADPTPTPKASTEIKDPWEVSVKMNITGGYNKVSMKTSGISKENKRDAWNKVYREYKGVIIGVLGMGTLTMVALFTVNFIRLGKSASNPQERKQAVNALLWTGIAAAGLGGATMFVGFSYNLLR